MYKGKVCWKIVVILSLGILMAGSLGLGLFAQWKYDVTLTGYPDARWKALTSYIDKPALGDVTDDGVPEIIAASIFGDVFCIDGATGQILWTYEDEHSFDLAIYICPAVVDVNCDNVVDVISVTPQGNIICLDGRNGRKLWSFHADAPIVYSPTAFDLDRNGTPEIAASDVRGTLYVVSNTGKLLWSHKSEELFYGAPAMGLLGDTSAVIMSGRSGQLFCFNGSNGQLIWKFSSSTSPLSTSPILFKDHGDPAVPLKVLVGSEKGEAFMVNAMTGAPVWKRVLAQNEALSDFSLGDITGDGRLDLVCSTSGSQVLAASVADGKEVWSRKLKVPTKTYLPIGQRKKVQQTVVAGEPILADCDGDGILDTIVEIRGLNNYIYCLHGSDGRVLWKYGNKDLLKHPALNESTVLSTFQEVLPLSTFSQTVPVYSQPTPVLSDFRRIGKTDLIVNDRDEIGLISVPLAFSTPSGTWAKYVDNMCNNMVNFSESCLGPAVPPIVHLSVDPKEIFKGQSARLCWTSTASGIEIDQGIGAVKPEDCVDVRPTQNTTWHAFSKTCGGEAKDEISLVLKTPPPTPPPILEAWDLEDVFFEYDWYRLTPEAIKTLDENIRKLKEHPKARVSLEATCDERGSTVYNRFLAVSRDQSVRDYMIQHGIDPSRLEIRPLGETTKWDSRLNDPGWALNRRVHFVILSR